MDDRLRHIEELYKLLAYLEDIVGGKRLLQDCHGRLEWPQRGVYFFFENGEFRRSFPSHMRVVRVGTHAVTSSSKSTLWHRLKTHRGSNQGAGNHRGSIFRSHVGKALINKSQGMIELSTWGQGKSAAKEIRLREATLEQQVSQHIGQMPFLWIEVNDPPSPLSERSFIERNAIALLSGSDGQSPIDPPSQEWLGKYSDRPKIQSSGLWNLEYVGEPNKPHHYDPIFLEKLAQVIHAMADKKEERI